MGAPTHRSYSQFSSYLHCPEQYRLTRVAGYEEAPAVYLIGGSAVHETTEWADRQSDTPSETEVLEQYRHNFDAQIAEATEIEQDTSKWRTAGRKTKDKPNGEDLDWWLTNGGEMSVAWTTWRIANPHLIIDTLPNGDPAIEVAMMMMFGEVPVKAGIDRVMVDTSTGERVIVDLKTGSREPDSKIQLAIYRYGMRQLFDRDIEWGSYWMARKGEWTSPHNLRIFTPDKLTRWLTTFDRAVREEIFIPKVSSMCKSCGVAQYCAAVGGREK